MERRYYGVFDGHGGVDAAVFAATHLQVLLSQEAELCSDAAAAFRHAFQLTDQMFREKAGREVGCCYLQLYVHISIYVDLCMYLCRESERNLWRNLHHTRTYRT